MGYKIDKKTRDFIKTLWTTAIVKIIYKDMSGIPKEEEQFLLNTKNGLPFHFWLIIDFIANAFENSMNREKQSAEPFSFLPEGFAAELISVAEQRGFYKMRPPMGKKIPGKLYEYTCDLELIEGLDWRWEMDLTLVENGYGVTKNLIEWKSLSDTVNLLTTAESTSFITMNDDIPCKECLVRVTCIQDNGRYLLVNGRCDRLVEYKKNEIIRLRTRLPDWVTPFLGF